MDIKAKELPKAVHLGFGVILIYYAGWKIIQTNSNYLVITREETFAHTLEDFIFSLHFYHKINTYSSEQLKKIFSWIARLSSKEIDVDIMKKNIENKTLRVAKLNE